MRIVIFIVNIALWLLARRQVRNISDEKRPIIRSWRDLQEFIDHHLAIEKERDRRGRAVSQALMYLRYEVSAAVADRVKELLKGTALPSEPRANIQELFKNEVEGKIVDPEEIRKMYEDDDFNHRLDIAIREKPTPW